MERSVHDALCVVKRVVESNSVVPGGGAVETALSVYLENFATSIVRGCGLGRAMWDVVVGGEGNPTKYTEKCLCFFFDAVVILHINNKCIVVLAVWQVF